MHNPAKAISLVAYVFLLGACSLTGPRRTILKETFSPVTLYVNAKTGNDRNSGLKPTSAKKTIQAAVDMAPSRIHNDFTIRVAPGVYRESVEFVGICAPSKHRLTVIGDDDVMLSDTVSPKVRLTGADDDSAKSKVRNRGFSFIGCFNIEINGFLIDYYNEFPVYARNSLVDLKRCKAGYSDTGYFANLSTMGLNECWSTQNQHGVCAYDLCEVYFTNSWIVDNKVYGAIVQGNSVLNMVGDNRINGNQQGLGIENSYLWVQSGLQRFSGNSVAAVALRYNSASRGIGHSEFSGNARDVVADDDSPAH